MKWPILLMLELVLACYLVLASLIAPSTVTPAQGVIVTGTQSPQGTLGSSTQSPNTDTLVSNVTMTQLTYGTSTNQVNLIVSQDRTLTTSQSETLDLWGHTTPLADIFGSNCLFLHIKYILIFILPGTGDITGLTIGAAASNPWLPAAVGGTAPTTTIFPGGPGWCLGEPTAGFVVSSTSGQLKVANNSASVVTNYRIVIGGTTT